MESEEFDVTVGMQQGYVLTSFLFAVAVDVVSDLVREGVLSELVYADDVVLMSETMEGLRDKFRKWKEAFESQRMVSWEYHNDGQRWHHKGWLV